MSVQVEAIRVKNVAKGEVEKFRVVAVVPRENGKPQKVGGGGDNGGDSGDRGGGGGVR